MYQRILHLRRFHNAVIASDKLLIRMYEAYQREYPTPETLHHLTRQRSALIADQATLAAMNALDDGTDA
jgi:hypothetical protein